MKTSYFDTCVCRCIFVRGGRLCKIECTEHRFGWERGEEGYSFKPMKAGEFVEE